MGAVVNLTEFLLARIAEDEAVARGAIEGHPARSASWWDDQDDEDGPMPSLGIDGSCSLQQALHIARFDPARVLAECEAKRRIVEWHSETHECEDGVAWMPQHIFRTLVVLAQPYADHPDFDPSWRL